MEAAVNLISANDLFSPMEAFLAEGNQAQFTVSGMSMWPFVANGRDKVIVEACSEKDIRPGDAVLFQTPSGKYLLHRVTKLLPDEMETTGDGNCFRDGWFPRSCVKARVVSYIRKGKEIHCTTPTWRLVFQCWGLLFPIRPLLLRILVFLSRKHTS